MAVAPGMFVQSVKVALQRSHWYVKVALVLQVPLVVLSAFPTPGSPVSEGGPSRQAERCRRLQP